VGASAKKQPVIRSEKLHGWLAENGVDFYAGVPDSLLKAFCAFIQDEVAESRHVITANEGGAVAMAMGYHLATGRVGAVYLQNSGLGNTVNPLTSLADPAVYGVPMILIVGWRGEPGVSDEPQHRHMGKVTLPVLDALEVPHALLPSDEAAAHEVVTELVAEARRRQAPHALVVQKGILAKYSGKEAPASDYALTREQVIEAVVGVLPSDAVVVSTTGKPSRELFEARGRAGEPNRDLLVVGGMGHASQIALGVALARPERQTWCIDGDGAMLMHMGGLTTIGTRRPPRFKHVLVNNAAHDSVGGQPTVAHAIDLCAVARASGYTSTERVDQAAELEPALARLREASGPALVEVRICKGARADLGRPTMTPADLKDAFMAHLGSST
jgi:phosphonopyruvate decarboxylase